MEQDARPSVALNHRHLRLQLRPGADIGKREQLLADWYRDQLKQSVPALLARWQPLVGVRAERFYVQRMKTKWGSCNTAARTIRLNTELAKKPPECLEYIVVHELVHLREPTHNDHFVAWMNKLLPRWRDSRDMLNRLPVRNEHWDY